MIANAFRREVSWIWWRKFYFKTLKISVFVMLGNERRVSGNFGTLLINRRNLLRLEDWSLTC
ncbi:MAG: hypothetical protein ACTS5F_01675 [Candidatus Hodgkinia cicadicola]